MKTRKVSDPLSDFPSEHRRTVRARVPMTGVAVAAVALAAAAAGFVALRSNAPATTSVSQPEGEDVELQRQDVPAVPIAEDSGADAGEVPAALPSTGRARPSTSAVSGGWVTVASPVDLEIREKGELLGSTAVPRIMLPVGRHRLEIGSTAIGFRRTKTVDVAAGRTTAVTVAIPNGRLNVNAVPWANVSVDGHNVGQTPLANLSIPVGRHEVVLRHPQLGERREIVFVSLGAVTRLGVDLSR